LSNIRRRKNPCAGNHYLKMSSPLKPLSWYKKLASRKGRLAAGAFIVEGDRAIRQVISRRPGEIAEVLATEKPSGIYRDYPLRLVTGSQFDSISQTRTPQGIMAVVRLPAEIYSDDLPGMAGGKILLLEDIQDPGNVGTLIRTAAAFDYSGVIMTESCADPFSPKCVQASAGTVLSLWLRRTSRYLELAAALQKDGCPLIAADLEGTAGPEVFKGTGSLILALGNEAAGLSEAVLKAADHRLRIPVDSEKAESLNVAVCGAICMYLSSQG
jgi:TrmH family RNA methyltransferase